MQGIDLSQLILELRQAFKTVQEALLTRDERLSKEINVQNSNWERVTAIIESHHKALEAHEKLLMQIIHVLKTTGVAKEEPPKGNTVH